LADTHTLGRDGDAGARQAAIHVAFTPAEIPPAEVVVVIDVLRATSTLAQALESGYRRVLCCESLAAARGLRAPGRVLAGESECLQVPGFELGNSPAAIASGEPLADELVLATTNGSPAIVAASRAAGRVLVGSLLNLGAICSAIQSQARVALACSGTDGRPALEDVYVAGRIVEQLGGGLSDSARVAACVAAAYRDPLEPLAASADGAALRSSGQGGDISWCARESTIDLAPEVSAIERGAAVVTAASHRRSEAAGSGADRLSYFSIRDD
jgi:2-phosphosulfolactate phosphatase